MDLSFSPNNEFLLNTCDNEEIAFWDIRNLNWKLFSYNCPDISSMSYYISEEPWLLVSTERRVGILDLSMNYDNDKQFYYYGHIFSNI